MFFVYRSVQSSATSKAGCKPALRQCQTAPARRREVFLNLTRAVKIGYVVDVNQPSEQAAMQITRQVLDFLDERAKRRGPACCTPWI
jgi:GH25 family lysozyme M1 (1,4-beta-N-acetylmuramidase)